MARRSLELVAVGHLRDEKDPLDADGARRAGCLRRRRSASCTSARRSTPELGDAARPTMAECPHYRWLGGLPHAAARRRIARAGALVHMSRIEGGANVVIEAVRSGVPVLASRIDGNLGLLGADYEGCFAAGDAAALAALMQRFCGRRRHSRRAWRHSARCANPISPHRPNAEACGACCATCSRHHNRRDPRKPSMNDRTLSPAIRLTSFSHGGGCGCKIAPGVLSEILKRSSGGGLFRRSCWSASRPPTTPRSTGSTTSRR